MTDHNSKRKNKFTFYYSRLQFVMQVILLFDFCFFLAKPFWNISKKPWEPFAIFAISSSVCPQSSRRSLSTVATLFHFFSIKILRRHLSIYQNDLAPVLNGLRRTLSIRHLKKCNSRPLQASLYKLRPDRSIEPTALTAESKEHRVWRRNECYALCALHYANILCELCERLEENWSNVE